jgi:hypothetical protein
VEFELKLNIRTSLLEKPGFSGQKQQVRLLPEPLSNRPIFDT